MNQARNRIFISYRRSDSAGATTAIRTTLEERFPDQVFVDVTGLEPGASFPGELQEELARSRIVLAVIGDAWLSARNEYHQRRIDFPDDWVNIELSTALRNPEVVVIPVLVGDASMPPAKALPAEIRDLASRNAIHVRHEAWKETTDRLVQRIGEILIPSIAAKGQSTDLSMLELIRQAVRDALEVGNSPARQVLLATIDEISRLFQGAPLRPDTRQLFYLLLRRLLRRPVVEVAGYMKEIFPESRTVKTSEGHWLVYALNESYENRAYTLNGCVLLLPSAEKDGSVAVVDGAWAANEIELDYYAPPEGRPFVGIRQVVGGGGHPLGKDSFGIVAVKG